MRDLVTELRKEGSMRPRRKERVREQRRRRGGPEVEPGEGDRLAPSPEVFRARLSKAAKRTSAEVAAEGGKDARERSKGQRRSSQERAQRWMDVGRVQGSPLGRGGGPGS